MRLLNLMYLNPQRLAVVPPGRSSDILDALRQPAHVSSNWNTPGVHELDMAISQTACVSSEQPFQRGFRYTLTVACIVTWLFW